ncbi:MAG: hypothetical protein Q4F24_07135 [Eubacteriales bacterium]|nr:hypothetical protein [Eubacteriales bacterium]
MKKSMKYFLLGAGSVIAGLTAYTFFHEPTKHCEPESAKASDVTDTAVKHTVTLSKEYVERRRELARKRAAERAAETITAAPMAELDKTDGFTDNDMEPANEDSEKSEKTVEVAQGSNILLIKTKPAEEGKNNDDENE